MQIIRATQYGASVECILYDDYCVTAPSVGHRSIMHVQVIFIPRFMYLCTRTLIHSISVYIYEEMCAFRENNAKVNYKFPTANRFAFVLLIHTLSNI